MTGSSVFWKARWSTCKVRGQEVKVSDLNNYAVWLPWLHVAMVTRIMIYNQLWKCKLQATVMHADIWIVLIYLLFKYTCIYIIFSRLNKTYHTNNSIHTRLRLTTPTTKIPKNIVAYKTFLIKNNFQINKRAPMTQCCSPKTT